MRAARVLHHLGVGAETRKEAAMARKQSGKEHLYDLLKDFDTAMLVTYPAGGLAHARPMAIAELRPDADAFFVTAIDSVKIEEIEANPCVTLTFQSARQFASVSGRVGVVRDRASIERLWKDAWKVWFPQGLEDPAITLLKFDAQRGEYWDNTGVQGLKYVFDAAKALAAGEQPSVSSEQNSKVAL
jgi:general stress protein 26